MTLPVSFTRGGFTPLEATITNKFKRLLIGTDGPPGSGKTEFALSAPGPGMLIGLDRSLDPVIDNPKPPTTRSKNFAVKMVAAPLASQVAQPIYLEYWKTFYAIFREATDNPDCRTCVIDGDSDSWELQRLAEFGKLTQIMPIRYAAVNAARRAMYARAWDSGKIIIATNKIQREYKLVKDAEGKPVMEDGKEKREWDGATYERQGFKDQDYLWNIQIRHQYAPPYKSISTGKQMPGQFGLKIMMCKANKELEGNELWGDDCNFQTLVQLVYPQIPLQKWGY